MQTKKLNFKRVISILLILTVLITSFTNAPKVYAITASSTVQDKINSLLGTYTPTITQTTVTSGSQTFTHPGIGLTKAMLNKMQTKVRAYQEPWASAFYRFTTDSNSPASSQSPLIRINTTTPQTDYLTIPDGTASGSYANLIEKYMEQDADTAFQQTVAWYITGNDTYRANAMNIIRAWDQLQSIGNVYDEQIRVSAAVYKFCAAADILRYSTCNTSTYSWTTSDTTAFTNFLTLTKSKYNRYTHFMNQHAFCDMGYMSAAIFTNNASDYATSVSRATTNPELGSSYDFTSSTCAHNQDGSIISQIRLVTTNASTGATLSTPNIQVVEMGRDQSHPYIDCVLLGSLAMISYCQGTKVDPSSGAISTSSNAVYMFNFLSNRILVGANYLAKYNLGNSVTYVPCYMSTSGGIYTSLTGTQGSYSDGLGIIYNWFKYFGGRTDLATSSESSYLHTMISNNYPEGPCQDFFGNSTLFYTYQ